MSSASTQTDFVAGPRKGIFVSYSRRDKRLFEEFKTMLAPAIRSGMVDLWDDTRIIPGANWREEIQKALASARVGVLLVSQHFLASDFIDRNELPPLLEAAKSEGLTIFWICLSSCLFETTTIATYQASHDVRRPLDRLERPERQAVLSEICAKLVEIAGNP
jgi:internalin A